MPTQHQALTASGAYFGESDSVIEGDGGAAVDGDFAGEKEGVAHSLVEEMMSLANEPRRKLVTTRKTIVRAALMRTLI